jgi:ATPase family AAA domain-containing protein 1
MPLRKFSTSPRNAGETSSSGNNAVAIAAAVLELGLVCVGSYFISNWLHRKLQEEMGRQGNTQAVQRLFDILRRRGLKRMPDLSSYEQSMAEDVVDPAVLLTEFKDIGGLDEIKQELWQLAVLPLKRPDLFSNNSLVQPPKGILLYGKPGTG